MCCVVDIFNSVIFLLLKKKVHMFHYDMLSFSWANSCVVNRINCVTHSVVDRIKCVTQLCCQVCYAVLLTASCVLHCCVDDRTKCVSTTLLC